MCTNAVCGSKVMTRRLEPTPERVFLFIWRDERLIDHSKNTRGGQLNYFAEVIVTAGLLVAELALSYLTDAESGDVFTYFISGSVGGIPQADRI